MSRLLLLCLLPLAMMLGPAGPSLINTPGAVPVISGLPTAYYQQTPTPEPAGNYLDRLFPFARNKAGSDDLGPGGWALAVLATLFYGQVAELAIIWILFSSDLVGIVVGLALLGLILAFGLPRRSRPLALFVLACLNALLAGSITLAVAFSENVPAVVVSLLPLAGLVYLATRRAFFGSKNPLPETRSVAGKQTRS